MRKFMYSVIAIIVMFSLISSNVHLDSSVLFKDMDVLSSFSNKAVDSSANTIVLSSAINSEFLEDISNAIQEFYKSMIPFFKNLSEKIVEFFLPAAELIYPYIHTYLPDVGTDTLAMILFYILLALIILLFIPKRKRKKSLPAIKLEESHRKIPSFNVKVLEEKETVKIDYEVDEKSMTIPVPEKIGKEEVVAKPGKSKMPYGGGVPYGQKRVEKIDSKSKVQKQVEPSEIKESIPSVSKEEVKNPLEEKKNVEKIVVEQVPGKIDKTKEAISPSDKEKGMEAKELNVKPLELKKETELPKEPVNEIKEKLETEEKEKPEKRDTETRLKGEAKEPSVPKEKAIPTEEREEEVSEETKSSLDLLLEKVKRESLEQESRKTEEEQAKGPIAPEKIGKEEEKAAKEPQQEKVHPLPSQVFKSGVVMDADSLLELLKLKKTEYLNQAFVSVSAQSHLEEDIKIKYRIGVITLTSIEINFVEDLAHRIASKISTAEAVLIAKKIKAKDVVVSDSPKITSYQGIKIHSLKDLLE
ncbi:MAG: hypothetical protein DRI33_01425 [Caldiserica bacterium]|nr:MAG: hypothetical protein DRI33_01425 [Caldisericota bacterium]